MKIFATLLLTLCTYTVFVQHKASEKLSQSIHDDGKTMVIEINGDAKGKPFTYHRSINVTGMSSSAKDALVNRITDSLGITTTNTRSAPPKPATPSVYNSSDDNNIHSSIHDNGHTMHVKISGTNKDKPVSYERTFKVKSLSAKEKNTMISHITDSLGISNNVSASTH